MKQHTAFNRSRSIWRTDQVIVGGSGLFYIHFQAAQPSPTWVPQGLASWNRTNVLVFPKHANHPLFYR